MVQAGSVLGTRTTATGSMGTECYGSEPLFAPVKNSQREDDGYILEVVYDGFEHMSELQVYRADNITDQVGKLKLKHPIPHQFHGYFTPEVFA